MIKRLLLLTGILTGVTALAQTEQYVYNGIINDSKLVLDLMEAQYPGYKQRVNDVFEASKTFSTRSSGTLEVNIVFHVVYQNEEQNIDDSVIYNQLAILNQDYNRLNADTVNMRSIFEPVAGNPHIHFNLAGIVRVPTSSTFSVGLNGMPDNVKKTSEGGSDAWNTDNYLNIWVCELESFFGALFGYAYPPAGLSNWPANSSAPNANLDGVVLDFRTIGSNNPVPYSNPQGGTFNFLGRTAVHEVGHYLGLRHTWGDGGGFWGGDSCGEDDGCSDTPNQGAQSSFDCNDQQNTCIDSVNNAPDPNDLPDQIENYMDYSSEACSNMFTIEQVIIMRSVLENQRDGLLTNTAALDEANIWSFSTYPVPAKNYFEINFGKVYPRNKQISLYNLAGAEIWSNPSAKEGVIRIDLTEIPAGVYFVSCTAKQQRVTQKVVVNK